MMKTIRPWVKALGISESDYQRWSSSVPAGDSITFYCLQDGLIPVDAYLDWAKENFGLPVLRSEFFLRKPDTSLFEKIKSAANWSRELVPIHEWDGVIFVACVEPSEVQWSFPVQHVLASPADMAKYWHQLESYAIEQEAEEPEVAPIAVVTPPPTLAPVAPTPSPAPVPFEFTSSTIAAPVPTKTAPPPPPPATTAAPKKDADPFDTLTANIASSSTNTNSIEGLDLKVTTDVDLNIPEGFASTLTKTVPPSDKPSDPMEALMAELTNVTSLTTPAVPDNTNTAIEQAAVEVDLTATAQAEVPATASTENGQVAAVAALRDLASEFEGAMILKMNGTSLEPWAWDTHWKSLSPARVDLAEASAFRVVHRTKMPYLGHIVDTPINTAFFKNWGFETLPECILIQPLITQGNWVGMLVLKCDKSKKQTQLMAAAEKIAPNFAHFIATSTSQAA